MEAIFIGTLDGIYKIVPAGGGWKIAGQDLAGSSQRGLRRFARQAERR